MLTSRNFEDHRGSYSHKNKQSISHKSKFIDGKIYIEDEQRNSEHNRVPDNMHTFREITEEESKKESFD